MVKKTGKNNKNVLNWKLALSLIKTLTALGFPFSHLPPTDDL